MKNEKNINGFKWEMLSSAILYVVIGALLVLFPESIAKTFCYAIAIIVMSVGVVKIIGFFIRGKYVEQSKAGLIPGIFFVVLGILIIILARAIISAIPFVLGILITVSGFTKLSGAMEVKKRNSDFDAKKMYILAIINIVIGLVLALNPFRAAKIALVILGLGLIFTGISDIASSIYFYRKVKAHIEDMEALDQEYKEVK